MARSKSSNRWMQEHFDDNYVKLAQAKGYRSRAIFKLSEIQDKDQLIKPGMNIIDLGAAPGGWSQFARPLLGSSDQLVALDILPMEPLAGVDFIQGDFREPEVAEQLQTTLNGSPVHLVMSDMAPNITGNASIDQPRAMYLSELALATAQTLLSTNGSFLVKVFQGEGFDAYCREVRGYFNSVAIRKPKASRSRSNEVYVLAKGFK